MNKELDELLCLLDGKITAYRQKNIDSKHNILNINVINLQKEIQRLWQLNKDAPKLSNL